MKKFLEPLTYFGVGMLVLLALTLFLPAIGDAGDQVETDTAAYASNYWGFTWVVGSVKLLVVLIVLAIILVTVAIIWLKRR